MTLRMKVVGAVICGVLLLLGLLGVQSWRLGRAEEAVRTAQARELGARVQAALSDKVLTITETLHTKETIIRDVAHEEASGLRSTDAGRVPLDPGLRDRWRSSVVRVRAASEPATVDPGAGEPSPELPPA